MRFGALLPHAGHAADPDALVAVALAAEKQGFHSVWVGDHVLLPASTTDYPYATDGQYPVAPDRPFLEAFATLAYVACATSRVRLGVSVCVVPHRPIPLLTKTAATIDYLSKGRFVLGVASGWSGQEIGALGMPFEDRGAYTDEALEFCRAAWSTSNGRVSFDGEFTEMHDMYLMPKPPQGLALPIWVGGASKAAKRRAAQYGSTWYPPLWGMSTEGLRDGIAEVRAMAERFERPEGDAEIELAVVGDARFEDDADQLTPGTLNGTAAQMAERIDELGSIGVTELVLLLGGSGRRRIAFIDRFHDEVLPLLQGVA
jgi:probable F420-dependent oxidoreductase